MTDTFYACVLLCTDGNGYEGSNAGRMCSTPENGHEYNRIRKEQCSNKLYVLDTKSPDAVHPRYMREFWETESKHGIGCKKKLWEYCFAPESRLAMWKRMEVGHLSEGRNDNHLQQKACEENDESNILDTPPCPSNSQSIDSLTQLERRRFLINATIQWESQVIEEDGEEVVKHSLSSEILNAIFPIPKRGRL